MIAIDEVHQVAMEIILNAGNGRTKIKSALVAMEECDFDKARTDLDAAQEEITKAHRAQTKLIQSEARGEEIPSSILFVHAQDTLMTIKSEQNIAERLMGITDAFNRRLIALENEK
ncbi:PTS lactose/cellobiose transporter subunit IIA [Actinomycetaceae bacterium MB13-C1-2]|nr:PTS lactose/cellobiose transporter subunit IIA [Actinomycetaceae bacterium MB13-C1-2]